MKLTIKDQGYLDRVLCQLKRADDYISQDTIHLCCEVEFTYKGKYDFKNDEGLKIMSINKELGSNLCGLKTGIRSLQCFIDRNN